ncbi:hypothetical protein [Candidatus Nitronereus thalassa]|uniref:STAS domain-containing protein n=1 Tax=Candidatus Nitronereus thalassa TaxID=3020898 RepID=A0ABU3KA99_9BACT|nr:hypothetical protein [Candidatus Nitronereus thalassa]MDT7043309.1 hypothetical protein [Candidatus Nitronereus thalassa]
MPLISFPRQCQNDINIYRTTVELYYETKKNPGDRIIFECGDVGFFRPFGLNLLASFIYEFLRENPENVYLTLPKNPKVVEYMKNQGFFDYFRVPHLGANVTYEPLSTSVAIKRLEYLDYSYFEKLGDWLYSNCPIDLEIARAIVNTPFVEVINNVFDHSKSPIGCFSCAQAYPREKRLIISVLDLGVGFLSTLKPAFPHLESEVDAIEHAVGEGVTSKTERHGGSGLWILSGFLETCGGKLEITSGNGFWSQNMDGVLAKTKIPFDLPGSCINISIDNLGVLSSIFSDDH